MARSSLEKIQSFTTLIEGLDGEIDQARAEQGMLQHIDDDAQRDAAVSDHAEDRQDARQSAGDVQRMDRHIEKLVSKRAKLVARRDRVLRKLQAK